MKHFIYIFLIILLIYVIGYDKYNLSTNSIRIDTVYKTVQLPPVNKTIYIDKLIPVKEIKYIIDPKLKDSISILNELIRSKTVRVYHKQYEDSLVLVELEARVEGILLYNRFKYTLKRSNIKCISTHTKETKHLKHALYYGLQVNTGNVIKHLSLGFSLGYQNKLGNIYKFGYNSNKEFTLSLSKRFLVKY